MIAGPIATLARFVAGSTVRWTAGAPGASGQCVYIANHTSHLDFVVLWSYLPATVRQRTRPVAAADYWSGGVRRYLAAHVFCAVLIDRRATDVGVGGGTLGRLAVESMTEALADGSSLILFPEGTRGDGIRVGSFRSGLYHLCRTRPDVQVVPVHLSNLNRILPKGATLPVPMLSRITFGAPLHLEAAEEKDAFLNRARRAVEELGTV